MNYPVYITFNLYHYFFAYSYATIVSINLQQIVKLTLTSKIKTRYVIIPSSRSDI